jgi:hypothetical protein
MSAVKRAKEIAAGTAENVAWVIEIGAGKACLSHNQFSRTLRGASEPLRKRVPCSIDPTGGIATRSLAAVELRGELQIDAPPGDQQP